MGLTDTRERLVADSQFGGGATTWAPATWYLGLTTTTPNDDGTNFTEPVGGAYARVARTNNATNFPAASTVAGVTTKTNGTACTFPTPTGNWGPVVGWGWFEAASGGTAQVINPLTDNGTITVASGNTPVEMAAGTLLMTWD